jgi:amidohydrolase ring-opening protein AtzD/TrzD
MPIFNMRLAALARLVDINRATALSYITERDGGVVVGAMARQRTAERSALIAARVPLLVFAKCEPDLSCATRGRRHVMFDDSDMNYTRHIRGVVSAVIASIAGDTTCYVSAGAEHQGLAGGRGAGLRELSLSATSSAGRWPVPIGTTMYGVSAR